MRNDTSQTVSVSWLHQHINNDNLIVLDATIKKVNDVGTFTSEEWIPKTRYFDLKGKFSDIEAEFPTTVSSEAQFQHEARALGIHQDSIIVVYDNKGIYSSARVWWLFKTFGFENVAVLDGGLPQWKQQNYETVNFLESKHWKTGNFSATYNAKNMIFFKGISEISTDKIGLILDARSEERFKGKAKEPRVGLRSGTIPNSQNLPYNVLLNDGCLKPKDELKVIFDTFNIEERRLVFSCGSGITACILALAACILGYQQIAVYDGSWTEYGTLIQ
ncbi:sulfurtransferase [Psychroserpens damuponensis]|uniref:sulfurtransferase n=1 Tax=Psychroserpens damuponensis TaxID=943936 RepID=UPI000590C998|nr:sulfurtransferase [Psychroserpens damuponensis]